MKVYPTPSGSPSLFPAPRHGDEIKRLFEAEVTVVDRISIASIIRDVCRETPSDAKNRCPNGFPLSHLEGHDRYTAIHDRLRTLNRSDFKCVTQHHPYGATTSYTSIETANTRILIRKFAYKGQVQRNKPFWALEHAKQNENQLDLGDFRHKAIVEIAYGLKNRIGEPAFVIARFPDGHGNYFEQTVDMLAEMDTTTVSVPVEEIYDAREATVKPQASKRAKKHA